MNHNNQTRNFSISNLLRDVSAFSLQPIFEKMITIILIPLYTSYLTVSDYGKISYYNTVTVVFLALTSLGLGPAFWRFISDKQYNKSEIYCGMVFTQQLAAILGSIFIMLAQAIGFIQNGSLLIVYILAASTQRAFGGFASHLRIEHKAFKYVVTNLSLTLVRILLTIFLVVQISHSYTSVIISRSVGFILFAFIGYTYLFRYHGVKINIEIITKMVKYGIPISFGALAGIVLTTSDRFIIQGFLGNKELGLYAYAHNYAMIFKGMIITPFIMAWVPNMWEIYRGEAGESVFPKIAKFFAGGLFLLSDFVVIAIILVAKVLTRGSEYLDGLYLYPVLLSAYMFYGLYLYEDKGYYFTNNTKYIMYNMLGAATLNIVLNLVMIPKLGILGAAISTLISYMVLRHVSYARVYKLYYYKREKIIEMVLQIVTLFAMIGQSIAIYRQLYLYVIIVAFVSIAIKLIVMWQTKYITMNSIKNITGMLRR